MMEKEIKDKWVAALRSGKYQQMHFAIHNGHGDTPPTQYCCLGVLAHITGHHHNATMYWERDIGLSDIQVSTCILLNDGGRAGMLDVVLGRQHTFNEIADYIEENM